MIRALTLHIKWLLAILVVLAAFGAAEALAGSVETYVDEVVPPAQNTYMGQPLNPGDLTMQDILKSSATAKAIEKKREDAIRKEMQADRARLMPQSPASNLKMPTLASPAPTAPVALVPQLQPLPSAKAASAGALLTEGMQSVFGAPNTGASPSLHAPDVPGVAVTAVAPVTSAHVVKGVSVTSLPEVGAATTTGAATGPCTPQTSSWIKTCAEAGYPDNYVGQIRGETRTTCPAGSLQDVWISNGCVPPEGNPSVAPTALTSPSTSSSTSVTVAATNASEPIDASCGPANGLAAPSRPTYDLCVSGYASPVSGDGPWHWSCQGKNGGMTVSCAASVALASANSSSAATTATPNSPLAEDAECGVANGVVADNAPSANLCFKGAASRVNGSGPWTWACSGSNGGKAAACNAPKKIEGICGAANGSGSDSMPMSDLCSNGFASAVTGNGPWAWTCSGLNGGQAATCSAEPRMNAVCGPASLNGHGDMPKNALCSVGLPSAVSGAGPWSWSCAGLNGGATVSCGAQVSQNGACGLAHGTSSATSPTDNLCGAGRATSVTGNGPWNWTCLGSDGGDTASCTAARASQHVPVPVAPVPPPKPVAPAVIAPAVSAPVSIAPVQPPATAAAVAAADTGNLCGDASEFVAIEAPIKNLCKSGNASPLSGNGPWSWTCADHGKQSYCSTLDLAAPSKESAAPAATPVPAAAEPQTATCGIAAGQGALQQPSSGLCAVGKAGSVTGNGPWTWNCTKGKSHTSCQAAKLSDGACGAANGSVQRTAPATSLCNAGTATPIQGNGPWIWSCIGSGGGASISCSAASQAQTRVDGSCGVASSSALSSTPTANLCDSGVASGVYGAGPWTWTCSGLNGGVAASCSVQKNTPPAPPPPGPAVNGLCGSSNGLAMIVQPMDSLCTTGTATAVSGNGPWNWNCIGENSGMTVSCTAPLQPPAPISGVCGQANGVPTLTTPKSGLCSGGISSAVSGKGPWTWSCSGVNGGGAVGCVAPLAGGNYGSLPSMTTQSSEAPAPMAAPTASVAKRGLVTPRMPSGAMPPVQTGSFPAATRMPEMSAPSEAPQLPDDTPSVTPPPVRDYIQPAPALRSDVSGNVLPGNHFTLDADLASMPFVRGSDNFDTSVAAKLDKLANVLASNGGVRVTLTAYADNSGTTPREARRLSLGRALAIRDYLTAKGISSGRIDVRALGANVPSGEPDRVDIKPN